MARDGLRPCVGKICMSLGGCLLLLTFSMVGCFTPPPEDEIWQEPFFGLKRTIAVATLENKTDYGKGDVGSGMADMLVTALHKSGHFEVIERQELETILREQKLSLTGAVTTESAVEVGRLLGAQAIVLGSVTEFGEKVDTGEIGKEDKGKLKWITRSARVAVDVRVVNTSTGQIIASDAGIGEEKKGGFGWKSEEFDFGNADLEKDQTLVGKATRKAINQLVKKIIVQLEEIAWYGKIIKVSESEIYFKPGSASGVKIGHQFDVYALGEELIDPETGLVLGQEEQWAGRIEVVQLIETRAAKAIVMEGGGFQVGDIVREIPSPPEDQP